MRSTGWATTSTRLPRVRDWAHDLANEAYWLPQLAPLLPLSVPEPVAMGGPAAGYPFQWAVYRWLDGQTYAPDLVTDQHQAARDLAAFVAALRRIKLEGLGGRVVKCPFVSRTPRHGRRLPHSDRPSTSLP